MKTIFFLLIALFLMGCGSNKLELSAIKTLDFQYNQQRPIHFGDTISLMVFAVKKSGEKINVSNNPNFSLTGDGFYFDKKESKLIIETRPRNKNTSHLDLNAVLKSGKNEKKVTHKLNFNFQGPLFVDFRGESGDQARNRLNRFGRMVLTEGREGRNGDNGEDGANANPITAYVWQNEKLNTVYVKVEMNHKDSTWTYQSSNCDKITIDVSGGDGGSGGNGGDGGRGRRGSKSEDRLPGNGGDGGDGGNGGNGGNGASVMVFIHPNASIFKQKLIVRNEGGRAGKAGLAGQGGKAGRPASGQEEAQDGQPGKDGLIGKKGLDGPEPVIQIKEFSIN